jgi:hypothetical protein
MNTVTELSRKDINNMVRIAAGQNVRTPQAIYRELYREVEKRSGVCVVSLAEKYKISMIDVLESEKLFDIAASILNE